MKRISLIILAVAAIIAGSVSCQKSIEPSNPAEEGKGTIDICVSGLMDEYTQQDGVKSSLVNNVRVAWAAGDVVYVFDGSNYLGKLSAALDKKADGQTDEDRYAKLGGTISAPSTTPCVLSLVHSSLMTEPETGAAVSELSIDMSAQSTETAPFVAYATMDYIGESISDIVVPFQFATSVIKVNCTGLKANTAITSATLSNVNTACKLTLSSNVAPSVSGDVNGTITRTGDSYFAVEKVNGEGEAVFQIAVPILETASGARVLTVAQGSDKVKDKKFTTNSLVAATSVNTICQLVDLPAGALPGVFTVDDPDGNPGSGDEKKIHFSKGNLYYNGSKFDFEANQYKYHGYDSANNIWGLFGWVGASSTTFNSSPEIYGVSTSATSSDYGNVAGEALKADWGTAIDDKGTWSTLSTTEWQYLFNKHIKKWVTVNSVKGYVIAPDGFEGELANSYANDAALADAGNLVFFPAAGDRDGSNVYDVGADGLYWSSTAFVEFTAYLVSFDGDDVSPGRIDARSLGCSVRLVTEDK